MNGYDVELMICMIQILIDSLPELMNGCLFSIASHNFDILFEIKS